MAPNTPNSRALATQRPQSAMTVDNLFRRVLKVANPRDPDEVAKALLLRYKTDAALIKREQSGVPFSAAQYAEQVMKVSGPLSSEIHQATDDLERDLGALVSDIQLKDIAPELRGLANAVRNAAGMGLDAARLALDPSQRDRAFAARRTLGDYARIVRLLGALTACATALYCRVAQSIDMCASLILVSMGEALAASGVTKSGILPQVPADELVSRGEAVINALRRLNGSESDVVGAISTLVRIGGGKRGDGSVPLPVSDFGELSDLLSEPDTTDLRSLLDEGYLSMALDGLISQVSSATPDGLRSIGSTAVVAIQAFERLTNVVKATVPRDVLGGLVDAGLMGRPLIREFIQSIDLLTKAFNSTSSGYRLPYLARPALLSYGMYGLGGMDEATSRLLELSVARVKIAEQIDCLCCGCAPDQALMAAAASKGLYDLDRAIDLYALGTGKLGVDESERLAGAYGLVLQILHEALTDGPPKEKKKKYIQTPSLGDAFGKAAAVLAKTRPTAELAAVILCRQISDEKNWTELVDRLTPNCDKEKILYWRTKDGRLIPLGQEIAEEAYRLISKDRLPCVQPTKT